MIARNSWQGGLTVFVLLAMGSASALADYTITSSTSDFEARVVLGSGGPTGDFDPGGSITTTSLRVGVSGGANNRVYGNAALFFQLPILQAGETITSANLRLTELADPTHGNPTINADLWAIGYDNTAPPLNNAAESQSYFFNGTVDANPGVGAGAVRALIQNNFLVPADVIGTGGTPAPHETGTLGDASLLAYIQSLYANPNVIPGTSSVILRLNYDNDTYAPVFATPVNHYTVGSGDSASVGFRPTLTLTTQQIPEPGMIGVLAAGALLLVARRRMKNV